MTVDTASWSHTEKAGALVLALLAVGLGLIAADIISGGRLFSRPCTDCAGTEAEAASDVS